MADPIWFVVERVPGGETAAIYHQVLPERLTRKVAPPGLAPIIYQLRLDRLPDAGAGCLALSIPELYRRYLFARDHGKLVHNTADPPRAKAEGGRLLGDRWHPKAPPFNHDPRVDEDFTHTAAAPPIWSSE